MNLKPLESPVPDLAGHVALLQPGDSTILAVDLGGRLCIQFVILPPLGIAARLFFVNHLERLLLTAEHKRIPTVHFPVRPLAARGSM